ncbi:MAG: secretion protein, partial [Bacteroidales bacterium]|nr:secretion protein [Bacteroidales bacterium]
MTNRFLSLVLLSIATILTFNPVQAATKTASVRIDSTIKHQRITGFGGFVCSPQFGYNHMSETEIRRVWGKTSDAGYNIMRLYIPEGKSGWSQSLATAKLAQSLGLIIFASPWTMPAEWKTNNHIAAVYTDANGVEQVGYLKEEHYADYANYLNDYVTYLRTNGVNLEAISIQNEPDMRSSYHGCIWTPDQMATFIKRYGYLINCKIMASDGVGMSDNYVNAFNNDSVLAQLDYFAGHQYGYIQSGFKKLQAKGLEAWMTEYLINWNDKQTTGRNFNWNSDAFTFAAAVNNALLANVNAWIHYATKRFYGLMGDGTYGTPSGVISKRGHILSHYAQHVTGKTRIECLWKDDSGVLTGS